MNTFPVAKAQKREKDYSIFPMYKIVTFESTQVDRCNFIWRRISCQKSHVAMRIFSRLRLFTLYFRFLVLSINTSDYSNSTKQRMSLRIIIYASMLLPLLRLSADVFDISLNHMLSRCLNCIVKSITDAWSGFFCIQNIIQILFSTYEKSWTTPREWKWLTTILFTSDFSLLTLCAKIACVKYNQQKKV